MIVEEDFAYEAIGISSDRAGVPEAGAIKLEGLQLGVGLAGGRARSWRGPPAGNAVDEACQKLALTLFGGFQDFELVTGSPNLGVMIAILLEGSRGACE